MKLARIEFAKRTGKLDKLYSIMVNKKIRAKYSLADELAILRQRDTKPEEYEEYNAFAEAAKAEAKAELENPETDSFTVDAVLTREDTEESSEPTEGEAESE